jgi:hydrogenase nickel incorporation protein HypB
MRVVLISVPEGHDKPLKYPKAVITSQVLIISKSDLLQYFDFDPDKIKKDALALNPDIEIIVTSATTGEGMEEWFEFIKKGMKKQGLRIPGFEGLSENKKGIF